MLTLAVHKLNIILCNTHADGYRGLSREHSKSYFFIQPPPSVCGYAVLLVVDWNNQNLYSAPTVITLVFAETVEPTLYVS